MEMVATAGDTGSSFSSSMKDDVVVDVNDMQSAAVGDMDTQSDGALRHSEGGSSSIVGSKCGVVQSTDGEL